MTPQKIPNHWSFFPRWCNRLCFNGLQRGGCGRRGGQIIDRAEQEANVWFPRLHQRSWERDLSSLHKQTRSRFWERDREREADRLAGRNARICWSWEFFFPLQSFFSCVLQPHAARKSLSLDPPHFLTVIQRNTTRTVSFHGLRNSLCQIWLPQHLLFQIIFPWTKKKRSFPSFTHTFHFNAAQLVWQKWAPKTNFPPVSLHPKSKNTKSLV